LPTKVGKQETRLNSIKDISQRIVEASRKLHSYGLVRGTSGNISARIPGTDTFLIKHSGGRMESLKPEELVLIDLQGNKIGGNLSISLETPMHVAIYRARKDAQAVVHTHAPTATAFGIAKTKIIPFQIEVFFLLPNGVPVIPFKAPGSKALGDAVQKKIANYDALILENHGIVTVGPSVEAACSLNEMVEESAKIQFMVMMLAGKDAANLAELKQKFKT
jgi:ribulose-5-phosphate 4-epimerase/fuculose-1-phosphate aldolase